MFLIFCELFLFSIHSNLQGDIALYVPESRSWSSQSNKMMPSNDFNIDMTTTEAAYGLEDVTFKSFVCPGGEVEITDASRCADESIILPQDQGLKTLCETEDCVISDSVIAKSYNDHIEHPYHNPEMKDASLVDINTSCPSESSNISLTTRDLGVKSVTQDIMAFQYTCLGKKDVTWKSFVCDGGEVEVSDVTRLQDETLPLPKTQLGEHLQDHSANATSLSDFGQLCQAEHEDHPYCGREDGVSVIATVSETSSGFEEPANGLSDLTFKSFNCTGGEIQISEGTTLAIETVPLPVDQMAACSETYNYNVDPSILISEQDVQNIDNHLDHPYCNTESYPSTPNGNLTTTQEPSLSSLGSVDEAEHLNMLLPDSHTNKQESVAVVSFINPGGEDEGSDGTRLPQTDSPLSDDQAVICQALDGNSSPSFTQMQIQENYQQPNSHLENKDLSGADHPAICISSLTNSSEKKEVDGSNFSQIQATSKNVSALPSELHRTESSDCSHLVTSTPLEVDQEHFSQEHLGSGPHVSREVRDSALGSSGNGPVLCDSAGKPNTENLPDVFKVLSECPAVASALQCGLLSPVIRRASLFVSEAKKAPAVDQFLTDDSALEVEKSFLAPVNVNPTGIWAEHLESPMPRPLFNSTALGSKFQAGSVTEPAEDVKPCAARLPEVEKPVLDIPLIQDGPLQQQLRQMAEFLFLASGKIGPAAVSAPLPPPAVVTVPSAKAPPVKSNSVCVGTTPMKWIDHSANTSGQFERKRDFSVVDSCTLTDPLLWK